AFIRGQRHGLHRLEIFATTEQFEHLLTVMNTGTNPRTTAPNTPDTPESSGAAAPAGQDAARSAGSGEWVATSFAAADGSAGGGWKVDTCPAGHGWKTSPASEGWVSGGGGVTACGSPAGGVSAATDTAPAATNDHEPSPADQPATGTATAAADQPATGTAAAEADQPATGTVRGEDDRPVAGTVRAEEGRPVPEEDPGAAGLDLRTLPQKRLDGLVGGCKAALAAGGVPAAGGLRPQVMVTIDYRDLLTRLGTATGGAAASAPVPGTAAAPAPVPGVPGPAGRALEHTGSLLFTGPVTAGTVRKIACDADIIPVLLGSEGRILDIGRASRIFPPHQRKALTALDRGCSFPGCTIPAPWCEAHHITYWSRGGGTSTDNGALLCSHHHHLIHKEHWTIQSRSGVPWFIPPPHIDPRQRPRRNHYFHPAQLPTAA
ncbi:HNH endonuclease signature motif containing protein, partial [Arthrobacter sp. NPDC058192]|uniref:HNH endonuclease signature motif containing protein n=1 Tax=Arthrobacter sp. NPDC058192 TaxID=3346372 RepID=UPI0036E76F3F